MSYKQFATLTGLLASYIAAPGAVLAQSDNVEEVIVIGRQEFIQREFTATRTGSNVDSAKLMTQVPGGGANNNGPLTGQIQYRGMFGPRINVTMDGMTIHGGGPNWMAPPLHHIPAGLMDELIVTQGIAPITSGGGIGGAATAMWKRPEYNSGREWKFTGDTETAFGTVDSSSSVSGIVGASSASHRIYAVGSRDEGDNYETPQGEVAATQYERDFFGIGYGYSDGTHSFDIHAHKLDTEDTGTPSLPMDIDWFETGTWSAKYRGDFDRFGIEVQLYGSDVDHGMSNSLLRTTPDFSSLPLPPFVGDDQRNVLTDSNESGFRVAVDFALGAGEVVIGADGKNADHHATVFDADFAPFFVNNFNNSRVDETAFFAQWCAVLDQAWYVEAGVRLADVKMSTGNVDAFPARLVDMNPAMWPMGTPPRAVWMLREAFNNSVRDQEDSNLDWVLKTRYQATDELVIELGFAQKVRSPMYQERYLWIPLEANAGLGDGNNYVGNPMLEPEQSRQVELGFDWTRGDFYFSPRLYRRDVDDYIQGIPATNMTVIGVSANANGDPTPLKFANTDAEFTGADMTLGFRFNSEVRFEGIYSTVDGKRGDINDNLYRVNPDNLRLAVYFARDQFNAKLEQVVVLDQDDVSLTNTLDPANPNNNSAGTAGYNLTNAFFGWDVGNGLALSAGIENLFDEDYTDHLTGFNRVLNIIVPQGSRMPGPGRNLFGRLQFRW